MGTGLSSHAKRPPRPHSGLLARRSSAYRSTAAEALMPHYTGLLASGYQNTFDMAQEANVVEKPYCGHLLQD